jgi:hypothetical protein
MQIYRLRRTSRWLAHGFGKNPLLRRTDRVEAILVVVAVTVALAVVPVAAASGVAIYGSHVQVYDIQAQTRHRVTATVVQASRQPNVPHVTTSGARVMWASGGGMHTDWYLADHPVKPGDHIDVWVNDSGARVMPPTQRSQAVIDAIEVGAGIWLMLALVLWLLVAMGRLPLNRIRQAQWESELNSLADGGRTNRPS